VQVKLVALAAVYVTYNTLDAALHLAYKDLKYASRRRLAIAVEGKSKQLDCSAGAGRLQHHPGYFETNNPSDMIKFGTY
jgi:hypothetical protein